MKRKNKMKRNTKELILISLLTMATMPNIATAARNDGGVTMRDGEQNTYILGSATTSSQGGFAAATGSNANVLIGYGISSSNPNWVVIGSNSKAVNNTGTPCGSIMIRSDTTNPYLYTVTPHGGIVIGNRAIGDGHLSIAIGAGSHAVDSGWDGLSGGLALGSNSYAGTLSSVALGTNAYAGGLHSLAIGANSNAGDNANVIVLGQNAVVLGNANNSIAIGSNTQVTKSNSFSVGSSSQARTIQFITDGKDNTDAINVKQLNDGLKNKANINLDNLTDDGVDTILDVIKSVNSDNLSITASSKEITATATTENGRKIYDLILTDNPSFNSVTNNSSTKTGTITTTGNTILGTSSSNTVKVATASTFSGSATFNNSVSFTNGFNTTALAINGTTYISSSGITANNKKIINITNGTISASSKEAINGGQLYETNQNVAQNTANIKNLKTDVSANTNNITNLQNSLNEANKNKADKNLGNLTSGAETIIKELAQSVDQTSSVSNTDGNLRIDTSVNGNKTNYTINLAKNISTNSYTVGNETYINEKGINGNNKTITNVNSGVIENGSTDLANGGQLYEVETSIRTIINNTANGLDSSLKEKANIDLGNLTDKGKNVVKELASSIDKTAAVSNSDKNLVVSTSSAGNTTTYTINLADNITANSYSIDNKTFISETGINANNTTIKNVVGGELSSNSTDLINGGQLFETNQKVERNSDELNTLRQEFNKNAAELKTHMEDIGAQSAAMSALHPLEWDATDKVSVAVSVGSFNSQIAGAFGTFYRPDQRSMVYVQGALGQNNNMISIGFSKRIGNIPFVGASTEIADLRSNIKQQVVSHLQTKLKNLKSSISSLKKAITLTETIKKESRIINETTI